ncbi:MAG: DUF58 domain-containing protein [Actinomycetota bacterium]
MPTRRGWAVIGAAIGSIIAGRSAGIKEMFAIGMAALLLPLAAAIVVRWGSVNIDVKRVMAVRRIFPGSRLRVDLQVRNAGSIPSPPLLVEDDASPAFGGPARFSLSSLPAGARVPVGIERTASIRGKYQLGPLRMRLIDPFGLAERRIVIGDLDRVVVFPKIEELVGDGPPADRAGAGPASVFRLAPEGDEFYGVREYERGDDLRKIHWRSVARTNQMMIRQEEARFFPRATIFVDTRRAAHRGIGSDSSLEWAISAAASAAWHLARRGYALRLATEDLAPTSPRSGREAADPLLEALATMRGTQLSSLATGLKRTARRPGSEGALIAIVASLDPEDLKLLARLRSLYTWCGAVLIDVESFAPRIAPRERANADQALAGAEATLARAGWRVRTADDKERFRDAWHGLTIGSASLPRSSSARL